MSLCNEPYTEKQIFYYFLPTKCYWHSFLLTQLEITLKIKFLVIPLAAKERKQYSEGERDYTES